MITIDFHGFIISTSSTNQGSISNLPWNIRSSPPPLAGARVLHQECLSKRRGNPLIVNVTSVILNYIILKDPQIRYQLIKHHQKTTKPIINYKTSKYCIYIDLSWLGICWDVIKPSNLPSHGWRRCAATRRYALRAPAAGMGKLLGGFE